jgi:hypothetical protein
MDELEQLLIEAARVPYEEKHRPENQKHIYKGFCINPVLRESFNYTKNEDRPHDEMNDWYGRPFIVGGERGYSVRCLNGGAWDRSSWCGDFDSLDSAIEYAKEIDGFVYC